MKQEPTVEIPASDLVDVMQILESLQPEGEDYMGTAVFSARLPEDEVFSLKWKLERALKDAMEKEKT
jgi:hypothetical protein